MKPNGLCMNCMKGTVKNGVCGVCGKPQYTETSRNANALPVNYVLHNRYHIGRVLGVGGFGITYMAWDNKLEHRVALKELYPASDVMRDQNGVSVRVLRGQEDYFNHVRKRFLDEAKMIHKFINNDEIINVYHLLTANNTAYYSMEYLEGSDLKARLKSDGVLKWNRLKPILMSVLRQLQVLHANDLIHRDISPDNIFLTNDGRVRLIDFGSVRTYKGGRPLTTFLKHSFAPIEQYGETGVQGPWTDVYAICVTAYYALSGKLPQNALDRRVKDNTTPIDELVPDVPPMAAAAIMQGMTVMPEHRPKNALVLMRMFDYTGTENKSNTSTLTQDNGFMLYVTDGVLRGRRLNLKQNVPATVGRDPDGTPQTSIRYPDRTPGVSRKHFTVICDTKNRLYIRDEGSRCGTTVNNTGISPHKWVNVQAGAKIRFGNECITIANVTSGRQI